MKFKKLILTFVFGVLGLLSFAACTSNQTATYAESEKAKFEESVKDVLDAETREVVLSALEQSGIPASSLSECGKWIADVLKADYSDTKNTLKLFDDLWKIKGVTHNKASRVVYYAMVATLEEQKADYPEAQASYDALVALGVSSFADALTILIEAEVNTRKYYTDAKIDTITTIIEKISENGPTNKADLKTLITTQKQALENGVGKISLNEWKVVTKTINAFAELFLAASGAELSTVASIYTHEDSAEIIHRYVKAQIAVLGGITDAMIAELVDEQEALFDDEGITEKGAILVAKVINPAFKTDGLSKQFLEKAYNKSALKDSFGDFSQYGKFIDICGKIVAGNATAQEKADLLNLLNSQG